MPDMQTELFTKVVPKLNTLNALKFDDDVDNGAPEVQVIQDAPEISANERVWNTVRDNPGVTCKTVSQLLDMHPSLVATRLRDMFDRKYLTRTGAWGTYAYRVSMDTYPRPDPAAIMEKLNAGRKKAHETMRKRKEAKLQAMAKAAEKKPVATKESAPPVAKLAPAVSVESRVSGLLSTLTLLEAKQLYIELFKVFGEVK